MVPPLYFMHRLPAHAAPLAVSKHYLPPCRLSLIHTPSIAFPSYHSSWLSSCRTPLLATPLRFPLLLRPPRPRGKYTNRRTDTHKASFPSFLLPPPGYLVVAPSVGCLSKQLGFFLLCHRAAWSWIETSPLGGQEPRYTPPPSCVHMALSSISPFSGDGQRWRRRGSQISTVAADGSIYLLPLLILMGGCFLLHISAHSLPCSFFILNQFLSFSFLVHLSLHVILSTNIPSLLLFLLLPPGAAIILLVVPFLLSSAAFIARCCCCC